MYTCLYRGLLNPSDWGLNLVFVTAYPMPKDLKKIVRMIVAKVTETDVIGNAAQVAFYFCFALFPLLLLLLNLFGIVFDDNGEVQERLFAILGRLMPVSALHLVEETIREVTEDASGGKLTFGIILTLWSASAGIDNVRGTLNEIYGLEETRPWWRAKLTSFLLTSVLGVLIIIAVSFGMYSSNILMSLTYMKTGPETVGWAVTITLLLCALMLLYNFAPDHDPYNWKCITPGAFLSVVLWLLFSAAFRLYLQYFDTYSATYGSLGAMIILLLWLYLTALVILIGGAVNAVLDSETESNK